MHEAFYEECWQKYHYRRKLDDHEARRTLRAQDNDTFTYLQDSSVGVLGYEVYRSPWQPAFCNWAFILARGQPCADAWKQIPTSTEVLITHGPPLGHGDLCSVQHLLAAPFRLLLSVAKSARRCALAMCRHPADTAHAAAAMFCQCSVCMCVCVCVCMCACARAGAHVSSLSLFPC